MNENEHAEQGWGHHGNYHEHDRGKWWRDRPIIIKVLLVLGGIALAIGGFFLLGLVVVALWNWLMPVIFHLPTIDFWQAWGLLILSSILFKNHGSGGHAGNHRRKRQMRHRMAEINRGGGTDPLGPGPREV